MNAAAAQPGLTLNELDHMLGLSSPQHTDVPPTPPSDDGQQQHLDVNAKHSSERDCDHTLIGRQLSEAARPSARRRQQHAPLKASREKGGAQSSGNVQRERALSAADVLTPSGHSAPTREGHGTDMYRPAVQNKGPATLQKLLRNRSAQKRYQHRLKV